MLAIVVVAAVADFDFDFGVALVAIEIASDGASAVVPTSSILAAATGTCRRQRRSPARSLACSSFARCSSAYKPDVNWYLRSMT